MMLGAYCLYVLDSALKGRPAAVCTTPLSANDRLAFYAFARELNRWMTHTVWS